MKKSVHLNWIIIILALISIITACASSTGGTKGSTRGNLNRLKTSKEAELRKSWQDYTVYKRGRDRSFQKGFVALVYKFKNDKKIKMPGKWVAVPNEESIADSKVLYLTDVRRILGQDDVLYGYIVLPSKDSALVKIIDANTVEIIYSHRVQRIGR